MNNSACYCIVCHVTILPGTVHMCGGAKPLSNLPADDLQRYDSIRLTEADVRRIVREELDRRSGNAAGGQS